MNMTWKNTDVKCEVTCTSFGTWRGFYQWCWSPLVTSPQRRRKGPVFRKPCFFPRRKIRLESNRMVEIWQQNPVRNRTKRHLKGNESSSNHSLTQAFFFCCLCQGGWKVKIQSMDICWDLLLFWQLPVVSSLESMGIQPYPFITHSLNGIGSSFYAEPTRKEQTNVFLTSWEFKGYFFPTIPPSQEK